MPNHFWRDNVIQSSLDLDIDEAMAEQRAILAADPNNAKAYFALGTLCHFRGDAEQAIDHFRKSIELDPDNPNPHLGLGRLLAVRGEYAEAWKHARAAEALGARDLVEMLERYPNLPKE